MYFQSADLYDAIYAGKDYASEAEQLHARIDALLPGARTLLEVGCGTGNFVLPLGRHYRRPRPRRGHAGDRPDEASRHRLPPR
jgi:ubiquinone/menaquinone biosynthesis C-methylase UbiE